MTIPPKGSLTTVNFITILQYAAEKQITGMIRLEKGRVIKVVYMQQGNIAFASSNEKSDRLTEVLKRGGKLTVEQIEDAQARIKPNVSLGKTLVDLGYLSPRDLLWGARAQVENILFQLLFWQEGNYQILEGALPKEIVSLTMAVPHVIFQGIVKSASRDWVLQQIESPQAIYTLAPDYYERNTIYKIPADSVASHLDGTNQIDEIAHATGLELFDVCKSVAALQLLGMAEKVEKPIPEVPIEEAPITNNMGEEKEQPLLFEPMVIPSDVEKTAEQKPLFEEVSPVKEEGVAGDVSLGQVLQLPTVEDLAKTTSDEEKLSTPAQFQEENAPQESPHEPEEYDEEESPVSLQQVEMESEEPEVAGLSMPAEDVLAAASTTNTHFPLAGMAYSARKKRSQNWGSWIIMVIIAAIVGIGGASYYSHREQSQAIQNSIEEGIVSEDKHSVEQSEAPETPESVPASTVTDPTASAKPSAPGPVTKSSPASMSLKSGNLQQAAALWKKELTGQRSKFTIQLVIACQEKTVHETFALFNNSNDLFVVPILYQGRPCYRILYGAFASEATARAARNRLPDVYVKQQSPAQVVSISRILR